MLEIKSFKNVKLGANLKTVNVIFKPKTIKGFFKMYIDKVLNELPGNVKL